MEVYFQIEKNPKKMFFSSKNRSELSANDYRVAAYSLLESAKEYHRFISKASNKDLNQVLDVFIPFLVNCGFVCELLLKALLCYEQTDYIALLRGKDRHSLKKLFTLLEPSTQDVIIQEYPYRYVRREDFQSCLEENAHVFYELRYSAEYTLLAGSGYFIPDLMTTLFKVIISKKI